MKEKNIIINFHVVEDALWMEKILIFLKSKYNIISIDELADYFERCIEIKNCCSLTFDDGHISFYEIVFPLLKKYNVPATIFVSPEILKNGGNFWFNSFLSADQEDLRRLIIERKNLDISKLKGIDNRDILKCLKIDEIFNFIKLSTYQDEMESQYMNVGHLQELVRSGLVSIGAHTNNHPVLANETDVVSKKEIYESIEGLEEILKKKVEYFAYPNGIPDMDFGVREINYLKEKNIKLAFSTESGFFNVMDDRFSIPRIGLKSESKYHASLKFLIGSKWDFLRENLLRYTEKKNRKKVYAMLDEKA